VTITLEIPDRLADALVPAGGDISRAALEAIALENYRNKRLTESQVRKLLGFDTRMEVHGFLKENGVYLHYTIEDLEHDIREAERYRALKAADTPVENRAGSPTLAP